jgi:hypothetical protein
MFLYSPILISLSVHFFIIFPHLLLAKNDITFKSFEYLKNFADALKALKHKKDPICNQTECGTGWGAHTICHSPVPKNVPCWFLSFGISTDWSFDTQVHAQYGCQGFALDPTITLPVKLTPGVIFLQAGANTRLDVPKNWSMFAPVELQMVLQRPLYILKMDCEGCEYVIARDVLKYDASFFNKVYQFNFEVHAPKRFLTDSTDAHSLGELYHLLHKAGLRLVHSDGMGCGQNDQAKGCVKTLTDAGFPCAPGCQSFLFARNESFVDWLNNNFKGGSL